MSDAKWIIEDGCLWYGPTAAQGWLDIWQSGTGQDDLDGSAYEALVQCVHDADRLATLVYGLRDIHFDRNGYCDACGGNFPCATRRLADELAPTKDGGS